MKRQSLVIPLLIISLYFLFSNKTFAEGQECCDAAAFWSYDQSTGMCVNAYASRGSIPPQPTACDHSTEYCDGDICVLGSLPDCEPGTVQCYDQDYRNSHIGCRWDGRQWYCGYPPPTPTPNENQVFCIDTNGKAKVENGINTAIGCIKVGSGNELITAILNIAIGLGGGIALALILYGVFIVTTSAGMPDKLKAGSEIITSAVVGLIFVLLSIFLVNLIGINILGIPGLS